MIGYIILGTIFSWAIYSFVRNERAFKARTRVADEIKKYNLELVEKGTYEANKLDFPELSGKSPTYSQMIFKFWIPLKEQEMKLRKVLGLTHKRVKLWTR